MKSTFQLIILVVCCLNFGSTRAQSERITTPKTDNMGASNSCQITILTGNGTFNYTIDWGDGSRRPFTDNTIYTATPPIL